MIIQVCAIRHGETDWNKERRIQGQTDIPLSDTGRAQALAMAYDAARHAFSAIYSSDLRRARDTAEVLAQREGLTVTMLAALRERNYGIFEGIIKEKAGLRYPAANVLYLARDPYYDFEGGESLLNFTQRVLAVFDSLRKHHMGQCIAVVCHAGVLDVLYRHATDRPLDSERDFAIPHCALNWFSHDGARWHVNHWHDHQDLK